MYTNQREMLFLELDLPSGEVEKEYMNFDEMFSEMLKECIS